MKISANRRPQGTSRISEPVTFLDMGNTTIRLNDSQSYSLWKELNKVWGGSVERNADDEGIGAKYGELQ